MVKENQNIDYNAARNEYLERLAKNPGVVSVIEFGKIKAPGLSDIDWLIIIDDKKIQDSSFIFLNNEVSQNTKKAFQHRPIIFPKKLMNNISEFIIPTKYKLHYGEDFNLLKDESINPYFRNITVGYEFLKRQKSLLRISNYQKLTKKKQISLFVSIANHRHNSIFSNIQEIANYKNEIEFLRNDFPTRIFTEKQLSNVRSFSIKIISLIEQCLDIEMKRKFHNLLNLKIKKNKNVDYLEHIVFKNRKTTLAKSLGLFPILYKMDNNNCPKEFNYFPLKYSIVKQNRDILLQIGLKDGLIGDLGFYNWFPVTIKDRLYKIKMNLKTNFS